MGDVAAALSVAAKDLSTKFARYSVAGVLSEWGQPPCGRILHPPPRCAHARSPRPLADAAGWKYVFKSSPGLTLTDAELSDAFLAAAGEGGTVKR
jgi:hypothetical protein